MSAQDSANGGDGLDALAVQVSRALNTLQPNRALAESVYRQSQQHADVHSFHRAISAFGRFSEHHARELYDRCQAQDILDRAFAQPGSSSASAAASAAHAGLHVVDHDVLEPDAPVQAGLSAASADRHVFRAPQRSTLGLDRLAAEKRREKEALERTGPAKRLKYDDDEEEQEDAGSFKSEDCCPLPPLDWD